MLTNSLHNSFVKSSIYISTDQVGIINLTQEICGGYEKVADGCAFFKKHHKISKQQAKRTSEIFQHCTVCCIRIIKKINWSFPVMKLVIFSRVNWNETRWKLKWANKYGYFQPWCTSTVFNFLIFFSKINFHFVSRIFHF